MKIHIKEPVNSDWKELLRFYCQTAQADDPSLDFMVSMWSYAIANEGLTGKQAKAAAKYIEHCLKQHGILMEVSNAENN